MPEVRGEDAVEQGLRTELILEGIFKCLTTRELLCCSQVNKLWNYQARLYIRDHRKCTVPKKPCPSFCSQLKELDEIIGGMSVVPFNSLQICVGGHSDCSNAGYPPVLKHHNLLFKLKLHHLFISCWNTSDPGFKVCPATFVVLTLLRKNASEIKTLRIQTIPSDLMKALARVQPQLPKLEELDLTEMDESLWEEDGNCLQAILRASSKLKKIIHLGDPQILHILTQHQYHMLTNFQCNDFAQSMVNGPEERCMKLAKSGPALTDLELWIYTCTEQNIRRSYEMLQLFLCSSCKSLERLWIYRICPLHSMITFPSLEVLRYLRLHSFVGSDRFMEMIQSIQFGRLFPTMRYISLESMPCTRPLQDFCRSPQLEDETEVEVLPDSPHSSASTKLAEITGDVCHIRFVQLARLFPHITNLSLLPLSNSSHAIPCRQIFRLWPHLKKLAKSGEACLEMYNCDAEFCGIDHAEVELLWLMDEEELRNLQIVPRRPCPITMRSLKSIQISLSLAYSFEAMPRERPQKFLSVVTKCLLLERFPGFNLQLRIFRGNDIRNLIFDIND